MLNNVTLYTHVCIFLPLSKVNQRQQAFGICNPEKACVFCIALALALFRFIHCAFMCLGIKNGNEILSSQYTRDVLCCRAPVHLVWRACVKAALVSIQAQTSVTSSS
jgi:hypothetical protein